VPLAPARSPVHPDSAFFFSTRASVHGTVGETDQQKQPVRAIIAAIASTLARGCVPLLRRVLEGPNRRYHPNGELRAKGSPGLEIMSQGAAFASNGPTSSPPRPPTAKLLRSIGAVRLEADYENVSWPSARKVLQLQGTTPLARLLGPIPTSRATSPKDAIARPVLAALVRRRILGGRAAQSAPLVGRQDLRRRERKFRNRHAPRSGCVLSFRRLSSWKRLTIARFVDRDPSQDPRGPGHLCDPAIHGAGTCRRTARGVWECLDEKGRDRTPRRFRP